MIKYYIAKLFETPTSIPTTVADENAIANILTIIFGIIGASCVLVITMAGFSYILSSGDPQKTTKAKDTILYAVIGLIISVSAFAVVQLFLGQI